jgi:hypothetical protein
MTNPENQEFGVADGERRERKMRARMQFEQANHRGNRRAYHFACLRGCPCAGN